MQGFQSPSAFSAIAVPHRLADLRAVLTELGGGPSHQAHVLSRWLQARPQASGRRALEHFLPRRLRDALPALLGGLDALVRITSSHPDPDGAVRLLLALHDGQTVEAVLLPRGGLCVSTQVGCAVGCTFCMTGVGGLARQLGSAEIAAQLALARTQRPVRKVVFMGMGEPAHNLDAVLESIDAFGRWGGVGHKNLVFSTVGDPRAFERLLALGPGDVRPALALSLHSTVGARRAELLPRAPRLTPAELVALGERYARATGYPMQVQWTLIEGVNDGDDEVEGLVALLRGRYAILNMIPVNRVDGMAHRRPGEERCTELFRSLNQRGVLTRLRQSAGQAVDGGCGQLRARDAGAQPLRWVAPQTRASA